MASKEMIEAMSAKDYWTSPGGMVRHATLYAAILREINEKGGRSPVSEDRKREVRPGRHDPCRDARNDPGEDGED